jgi:hypothetical protein
MVGKMPPWERENSGMVGKKELCSRLTPSEFVSFVWKQTFSGDRSFTMELNLRPFVYLHCLQKFHIEQKKQNQDFLVFFCGKGMGEDRSCEAIKCTV